MHLLNGKTYGHQILYIAGQTLKSTKPYVALYCELNAGHVLVCHTKIIGSMVQAVVADTLHIQVAGHPDRQRNSLLWRTISFHVCTYILLRLYD